MTFDTLLDKYRKESLTERAKGDKFERLMKAYLLTDPIYSNTLEKVWLWTEFPFRNQFGGNDTGIDLVAVNFAGEYWAIQCKFYAETATMEKAHVDSFISTSGKSFNDEELQTTAFQHRLWISTTNKWNRHAEETIRNQTPAVNRLNLSQLREARVDWEKLEHEVHGSEARLTVKSLFDHQNFAVRKAHEYFATRDRGKLIMACGTGKTFTSLRIAENETDGTGLILFLVPSISLLSQTLREWTGDVLEPIHPICICSDPKVSQKKSKNDDTEGFSITDLALPASTDIADITKQVKFARLQKKKGMTVVFSTYQSIEVISKAQQSLLPLGYGEFDLIICDEAHRTTGVKLESDEESAFVKVHNNDFIKAKKRLYMTATPRLYSDDSKGKAALAEATVWSMDDESLYGDEIYRIGFGEAVERELLTDYKVLILTVGEGDVSPALQKALADREGKIEADDILKLVGCINALSKQFIGDDGITKSIDPNQMKRAVAFCPKITASKAITGVFNDGTKAYVDSLPLHKRGEMVKVSAQHIDGTFAAPERDRLLDWLKQEPEPGECRVLANVRCLSEGVDVPSLDAVMFIAARNSQVDVVQSVGRVMRKAEGKKFGYIIIPIIVPSDIEAEKALDNNERYRVVWTVLNALRAHDDRFNATVNKINLNKLKPNQIIVGAPEISFENGQPTVRGDLDSTEPKTAINQQLKLQFEEYQGAIFARMVKKVGDRHYWEQWAKSVGDIAKRQVERIKRLIAAGGEHAKAFADFVAGLRKNINPSITDDEAIDMLSQHIITRPVFDALFENYSFIKSNPVSVSMQSMLDILDREGDAKEHETLQRFYEFVRRIVKDLDNPAAKQAVVLRLYDNFFKIAFPKMVERLGIVYTPVEVVDFIIHSVNDVLQKEFGCKLADPNVHILDPFTGTGTFITRLIQSGLIDKDALPHKYKNEIFANEIVLLAYYIAAVNIENAYHDAVGDVDYLPFEGICLTDTFQLGEKGKLQDLKGEIFQQNSERVERQKRAPLKVIFGNPPYSGKQKSANDNAQNQKYPKLDGDIDRTYARETEATSKTSLYNPYIKAFRWSTDRLGENGGIACFVTDGGWLTNNAFDGFRKCLEREFSSIYVFNLRGDARTSGELRRKEAGNVFGGGSRTPIAITLLVKGMQSQSGPATIWYEEVADYLDREAKLNLTKKVATVSSDSLEWIQLTPNVQGDWVAHRTDLFSEFIPISPEKKFDIQSESFFVVNSRGNETSRDAWVYNYSENRLRDKIESTVNVYNEQVKAYSQAKKQNPKLKPQNFVIRDEKQISWSSSLYQHAEREDLAVFEPERIGCAIYRPFNKQRAYLGDKMIHRRGQWYNLLPPNLTNSIICIPGKGGSKEVSPFVVNQIADLNVLEAGTQYFPLHYYEENRPDNPTLFDTVGEPQFVRRDGVSDFIAKRTKEQYGVQIKKKDIFYYVYGFLHSSEYRQKFANDLKKMLPRIPLVDELSDFVAFSKAGRKLADLHLNYEKVPAYKDVIVEGIESGRFTVTKMKFPAKTRKDTIIYNNFITISCVPPKAYDYVINGKSAIEWIMERYRVTVDLNAKGEGSGIKNDPNDWSEEVGKDRYILDLLLSVINVSVQTVDIVKQLPKVSFDS
ncbi:MAG: type ISP restriction/modification enzyme [Pyrinomonadaceae bacterium]